MAKFQFQTCHSIDFHIRIYITGVPGNCSSLQQITAPVNGEVLITSHLYGGLAKYKCNDGFTLMGDGIRNCTEDENTVKWSGSQPQCLNSELAFVTID